jgi:hypothetical protein
MDLDGGNLGTEKEEQKLISESVNVMLHLESRVVWG